EHHVYNLRNPLIFLAHSDEYNTGSQSVGQYNSPTEGWVPRRAAQLPASDSKAQFGASTLGICC
ncbi:MAG TPA: hypothetical protein PLP41_10380, partial [Treponemataceae bacterium]|nr:hypothetical protein [Treponemataceae bacterium]